MKNICILFIISWWMVGIAVAQSEDPDDELAWADSLYEHFHEKEALDAYQNILEKDPDNYTALWRTSFLYSRIGNRFESKDRQKEYFNRGIDLAERALKVDSANTQSHFVMAVAMGRKALISGAKERVAASRKIKEHAEEAIRLDSTNAGAWHVLGRWHFKVANLNFIERLAANTLFGGIPSASEVKAAEFIERAIELNPDYILYYYDLANVYEGMGKDQLAISTCKQGLQQQPLTPDDPELMEDCRELIRDLQ